MSSSLKLFFRRVAINVPFEPMWYQAETSRSGDDNFATSFPTWDDDSTDHDGMTDVCPIFETSKGLA